MLSTRPPIRAPDHRSEHRPPWPVLLGAPGASLTRPSRSLKPRVTHAHAVTTPLEPHSAPVRLAVVTMSPWPPENPHRPQENPNPTLSLDVLAASPRIRRSLHAPTRTFHRDHSHLTDAAIVLGRPPPWSKPPKALEDPSTCPTCPLEHYDAHAHHKPGLCRCTRATPAHRLCSSRRSPWPAPWEALAATLTPPT